MTPVAIKLNGQLVHTSVEPRTHLADFLREHQRLTGTHLGCEHGICGACTVLLDGAPVRSCITYAVACDGRQVQTIEGFGDDPLMNRLREAFSREHALQCGFCTPGMLVMARDICQRLPGADEERIRVELSGNLCRCTGYVGIVNAVKSVAADPAGDGPLEAKPALQEAKLPKFVPAPAEFIDDRKGWTRIEERFSVPHAPDEVWKVLADLPSAAACLPGATLSAHDADSAEGTVRVRFGPMSATFVSRATFERDDAGRRALIRGSGTDGVSNSRAHGEIAYRVLPDPAARGALVEVAMGYSLAGPLAQFSRSGLVKDFVGRLVAEFGRNLSMRIASPHVEARPAAELRAGSLFLSVLWRRIRRLFNTKT